MSSSQYLPLTTLPSVTLTILPIAGIWFYLRSYVSKKGAFNHADTLKYLWNLLVAHLSLALGIFILDIGHDFISSRIDLHPSPAALGYLYHLLKILERVDILFLVASGDTSVSKYVAFSRLFMPFWTLYRVVDRPGDSVDWRMQAIVDCLGRFAVFTVPYVVEDPSAEEPILAMCEEFRWYPDIAIFAFWAFFAAKGERESKKALEIFGNPYQDEVMGRVVGVAIVLYASYLKRQEDTKKASDAAKKESHPEKQDSQTDGATTSQPRNQKQKKR